MAYQFLSTILGIDANFTGNLGVGTTTPGAKLDVSTNAGRLRITQNTVGNTLNGLEFAAYNGTVLGGVIFNQSTGEIRLNTISSYFPTIYSNGAEVVRIPTSGNVLIGTTTDAGNKLYVNGTARVNTSLQVGNFTAGVAAAASTIFTNGRISASGGITFYNPAAGDNQETGFKAGGNGVAIYVGNATVGSFGGPGGATSPNLNLTSGFNPNSGSLDKTLLLINPTYQTSGTYTGGIIGFYYNPTLTSITGTAYHRAIQTVTGDVYLASTSGNVGIGSAPSSTYKLDVNGAARIQGNTTITGTNVPLGITGSGSSSYSMNSGNDVYFYFNSQSAIGRFYANPQGSVQNTYDQPVSVGFVGTNAGGDVWYGNMNTSGGTVKYNCSRNGVSHSHIWYYNFTEQMRLQYTGNLLIGTSTDSGYKLDVNGTGIFRNVLTGYVNSGSLVLGAAAANSQAITITGYYTSGGAISTTNSNARSYNLNIGGQSFGYSASYNGNSQAVSTTDSYFRAVGAINITAGTIALHGYNFSPTITSETGATIYAFSSTLNSASNHFNLYFSGTAKNYLAGNLLIGSTTDNGNKLQVTGNITASGGVIASTLGAQNSAEVNVNESSNNLLVYADITGGSNKLYSGGQVKANIYTSSVTTPTVINTGTTVSLMEWYPTTTQGVMIDYVFYIASGNYMRSGTFTAVNDNAGNTQYVDNATPDLNGSTSTVTFAAVDIGGTIEFQVTNSSGSPVYMNILTRYIPNIF